MKASVFFFTILLVYHASSSPIVQCSGDACDRRMTRSIVDAPLHPLKGEYICRDKICRLPASDHAQSNLSCHDCQAPVKLDEFGADG